MYSEPSRASRMELFPKLVNEIKPLTLFLERLLSGVFGGILINTLVYLIFFYYALACPMKVCLRIPFGRGLRCVETSQSFAKQTGWLVSVWFWFVLGSFRTEYSTVLFSEAAITKWSFVFIPAVILFLVILQAALLWVFLYFLSALILEEHTSMISSTVYVVYYYWFISSRNFNLTFCLFSFVNSMATLLGSVL